MSFKTLTKQEETNVCWDADRMIVFFKYQLLYFLEVVHCYIYSSLPFRVFLFLNSLICFKSQSFVQHFIMKRRNICHSKIQIIIQSTVFNVIIIKPSFATHLQIKTKILMRVKTKVEAMNPEIMYTKQMH